jgi:hypothetical protein
VEYECWEDGRRLIAAPWDVASSAAATAPAAAGRGGPARGGRGRGGPGAPAAAAAAAAAGPGKERNGGAAAAAWAAAFGEWPLALRWPPDGGGADGGDGGGAAAFRLVRLWACAEGAPPRAAAPSLVAAPRLTCGPWWFDCGGGAPLLRGALCTLRLPCVLAAPAAGGPQALDAARGALAGPWLAPATAAAAAAADGPL